MTKQLVQKIIRSMDHLASQGKLTVRGCDKIIRAAEDKMAEIKRYQERQRKPAGKRS